jgi:methyl-accepting chemotaxis protein
MMKSNRTANQLFLCTILFAAFLALPVSASASRVIDIADESARHEIQGDALDVHEDRNGTLTIGDVSSAAFAGRFTENTQRVPNFGYTRSAVWLRFTVKSGVEREWLLAVNYALLDTVTLYVPDGDGRFIEKKQGQLAPFRDRDLSHKHFIFKLKVPPGEPATCYLRVTSQNSLMVPVAALSYPAFAVGEMRDYCVSGLLYGILIIMIFYNLMIYISMKRKSYLYLVFYITMFLMYVMAESGFAGQYLWPGLVSWGQRAVPFFVGMVIVSSALFVREFLDTRRYLPRLDRVIVAYAGLGAVASLCALAVPYMFIIITVVVLIVFYSPVLIVGAFLLLREGDRAAKFFLAAWGALIVGALMYGLKAFGLLPGTAVTTYGVPVGAAIQVFLLSLGLADQLRQMNAELLSTKKGLDERNDYLEGIMRSADGMSQELVDISEEQGRIADQFALLASEQAALSEEMSATFEELTSSIESIDNSMTRQAEEGDKTRSMVDVLRKSQAEVARSSVTVVDHIGKIVESTKSTGSELSQMSEMMAIINEGGREINNIVSMINDITDKINLLSLNAAIEAARAGEHGRGFAVVADEIGKLAVATSDNSKEISTKIDRISKDILNGIAMVGVTRDSIDGVIKLISEISVQIDTVRQAMEKQGLAIVEVVTQAEVIRELASIIKTSTNEQKSAMMESITTVQRLTEMSQQITRDNDKITRFTRVIRDKSDELKNIVKVQPA